MQPAYQFFHILQKSVIRFSLQSQFFKFVKKMWVFLDDLQVCNYFFAQEPWYMVIDSKNMQSNKSFFLHVTSTVKNNVVSPGKSLVSMIKRIINVSIDWSETKWISDTFLAWFTSFPSTLFLSILNLQVIVLECLIIYWFQFFFLLYFLNVVDLH